MRVVAYLVALTGCGRLGFAPAQDADAPLDAPAAPSTYAAAVLADNPLTYYRLDEAPGSDVARDASGGGLDAIYYVEPGASGQGQLVRGVPGALADGNTAVSIYGLGNAPGPPDGSLSSLDTTGTGPAPWAGDFTVEGWVRPQPAPDGFSANFYCNENYAGPFDPRSSGFRMGWIGLAPRFWSTEADGGADLRSTHQMTAGVWTHLAFVRAGATLTIYVDGEDVGSTAADFKVPEMGADAGFGAKHGMPSIGDFDELAIYGAALSPERLRAHHAAARADVGSE